MKNRLLLLVLLAGFNAFSQKTEEEVFSFNNLDNKSTQIEFTIKNKGKDAGISYSIMYNSGTGWSTEKIFPESYKVSAGETRVIKWVFNPNFPKPKRIEFTVYWTRY